METRVRASIKLLSSGWALAFFMLIFVIETGWLAITSRFPMAYDEAYHFGLIKFFSHHLNPVITSQTADTYRFGPLVHDTPFLYHYPLSFAHRAINLFTHNPEIQIICLRFINIAIAVAGLLVLRKLLRLTRVSDALSNLIILALALTPVMTVVSAQINYDNLLILAVTACVYETIVFLRQLDRNRFDSKRFLILLNLCFFTSLIKVAFLPVFVAIAVVVLWKIIARRRAGASRFASTARRSFASIPSGARTFLLTAAVLGSLLFTWFYLVNMVEYRTPVPRCQQVLSIQKCAHYPPWNHLHKIQTYYDTHPLPYELGRAGFVSWWLTSNTFQLFGTQIPIAGTLSAPTTYLLIVMLIGALATVCTAMNFRNTLRRNPDLKILLAVSLIYLVFLWAWNYRDYLSIGVPSAIHGRYLLPVLAWVYIILASGVSYALRGRNMSVLAAKAALATVVIISFVYYGGFREYVRFVDPAYGRLGPSNDFVNRDAVTGE